MLNLGLESELGLAPHSIDWTEEAEVQAQRLREPWAGVGFAALWEVQSQLATVTLFVLLAVVPFLAVLAVMLTWSLVATVAYHLGRQRGLPDLLGTTTLRRDRPRASLFDWLRFGGASAAKVWLAGIQPFVYSRTFCLVLGRRARGWPMRAARLAVLATGLTLFGVTSSHHMLRRAGFSGNRVLTLGFVGSVLNVSYRLVLGAVIVNALRGAALTVL